MIFIQTGHFLIPVLILQFYFLLIRMDQIFDFVQDVEQSSTIL